uniref:7TM_GPCR_Srx domain-containing protein n=1 Tax=Rhabditophanes sp. KR3021 TaxID=114890 RepID=A0AC35TYT6_9BILA
MANVALADSVMMLLIGGASGLSILSQNYPKIMSKNGDNNTVLDYNHPATIPSFESHSLLQDNDNKLNSALCFLLTSSWISGVLSYAILGLNRCVAIRYYGTKAKIFNRVSIAITGSLFAWIIGIVMASLGTFPEPLIGLRSELWSISFTGHGSYSRRQIFFYSILSLNVVSICTQWICSLLVLLKIRIVKQKINKNKLNQNSANRFKKQARLTFQFFYPSLLCTISSIIFLSKPFLYTFLSGWQLITLHIIWICNHMCNPFIYSYFNERMRFTYKEIYNCAYLQYMIQKRKRLNNFTWTGRSQRFNARSTRASVKSCRSCRDGNFVRNSLQLQSRDFEQLCEFMMRVNPLYDSSEGWQECSDEEDSINHNNHSNTSPINTRRRNNGGCKDVTNDNSSITKETRSVVLNMGRDTVAQWVKFAKKASI